MNKDKLECLKELERTGKKGNKQEVVMSNNEHKHEPEILKAYKNKSKVRLKLEKGRCCNWCLYWIRNTEYCTILERVTLPVLACSSFKLEGLSYEF